MSTQTRNEILDGLKMVVALGQAVVAAGPDGIPSGVLYAAVCGKMTITSYESAIAMLVRTGIVTRQGQILKCGR